MKQLINAPGAVVAEALEALVSQNAHMARLDGFPDIKVVLNQSHDRTKCVSVIAGGGAGHEPAHAAYVGDGMLTAAVCGEVFASPSADAVLAAIRATVGPPGCLLIVKNYTGDRLHFGIAAEQAKAEGIKVEMVSVGEDCAIEAPGLAGRRGLAVTALVHKAAGAAAARGESLAAVAAAARAVASASATLGVALRPCTLPGKEASHARLADDKIEIGLGIHGEPGVETRDAMPVDELVTVMLARIVKSAHFGPISNGEHLLLLVNNLGSSTPLEMGVVTRAAVKQLSEKYGAVLDRLYVGAFVTSLDMAGMSLTLVRTAAAGGDVLLAGLDSRTAAPGFPAAPAKLNLTSPVPVPKAPGSGEGVMAGRPAKLSAQGAQLEACLLAAAESLVAAAVALDELDSQVGDGDCGSTVALAAEAIRADVTTKYPLNSAAGTMVQVATSVKRAVGGSSGALYAVFLSAAAGVLRKDAGDGAASAATWAAAMQAGTDAVSHYGGAVAGSRTMLDALLPAAQAAAHAAASVNSLNPGPAVAKAAAAAARAGADATKGMLPAAGRSSYVPAEVAARVPDPGAVAVATWMEAIAGAMAK